VKDEEEVGVVGLGDDYSEYEDYEMGEGYESTYQNSGDINLENRGRPFTDNIFITQVSYMVPVCTGINLLLLTVLRTYITNTGSGDSTVTGTVSVVFTKCFSFVKSH
jgi:hypothetical protein